MTEPERVDCTDCFALPGPDNTRVAYVKTGGGISETWHTPDCPALAITQINMEEGSERVREQDAWAWGAFPAAHERLRKAAAAMPTGTAAQAFHDEHGHLDVPIDHIDTVGFELGRFITTMRDARTAELDALGMIWDKHDAAWRARLTAAADYHHAHGHLAHRPPPPPGRSSPNSARSPPMTASTRPVLPT
ncbi:helicase associated domain-containing protein [Streptomyces sp. NRRL B-24720]|uniref:helicase associated domain-containing protein n=1 Tax=Streptomyces sp. NRRL B-24720 TaxID=1476876 RepID=UPI0004C5B7A2|nr:helicase associated domain-containing protein [Streptomyces sp. NRRL B-24720]